MSRTDSTARDVKPIEECLAVALRELDGVPGQVGLGKTNSPASIRRGKVIREESAELRRILSGDPGTSPCFAKPLKEIGMRLCDRSRELEYNDLELVNLATRFLSLAEETVDRDNLPLRGEIYDLFIGFYGNLREESSRSIYVGKREQLDEGIEEMRRASEHYKDPLWIPPPPGVSITTACCFVPNRGVYAISISVNNASESDLTDVTARIMKYNDTLIYLASESISAVEIPRGTTHDIVFDLEPSGTVSKGDRMDLSIRGEISFDCGGRKFGKEIIHTGNVELPVLYPMEIEDKEKPTCMRKLLRKKARKVVTAETIIDYGRASRGDLSVALKERLDLVATPLPVANSQGPFQLQYILKDDGGGIYGLKISILRKGKSLGIHTIADNKGRLGGVHTRIRSLVADIIPRVTGDIERPTPVSDELMMLIGRWTLAVERIIEIPWQEFLQASLLLVQCLQQRWAEAETEETPQELMNLRRKELLKLKNEMAMAETAIFHDLGRYVPSDQLVNIVGILDRLRNLL